MCPGLGRVVEMVSQAVKLGSYRLPSFVLDSPRRDRFCISWQDHEFAGEFSVPLTGADDTPYKASLPLAGALLCSPEFNARAVVGGKEAVAEKEDKDVCVVSLLVNSLIEIDPGQ